jgi:hypothetical protein
MLLVKKNLQRILEKLEAQPAGKGWTARCPSHDDGSPSLSINLGPDGKVLIHCHAGCKWKDVMRAAGFKSAKEEVAAGSPPVKADELHTVYQFLLDSLVLTLEDHDRLALRGLSDPVMRTNGYKTLPPVSLQHKLNEALRKKFPAGTLRKVPGLLVGSNKEIPPITTVGIADKRGGILVPIRNEQGLIRGLKVRHTDGDSPKYTLLSSPEAPATALVHYRGVGPGVRPERLILTEGELKADVIHHLYREPVLAVGGTDSAMRFLPALRRVKPYRVALAFDNDWRTNRGVWNGLHGLAVALKQDGYPTDLLTWPEAHKGLDDALAAGETPGIAPDGLRTLREHAPRDDNDLRTVVEVIRPFSEIGQERIEWLWPQVFPLGAVVLIEGDPDRGKTTATFDLLARVSRGDAMPDGSMVYGGPSDCLVLSCEDSASMVQRPRLEAAGANLDRVHTLKWFRAGTSKRQVTFPDDLGEMDRILTDLRPKIVVIDPFYAYVSGRTDTNSDHSIREVMHGLGELAETHGSLILVIRHLNKSEGKASMYRGGGSIGVVGAARGAMRVMPDDEAVNERLRSVIVPVKANWSKETVGWAYRTVDHKFLEGPLAGTSVAHVEWGRQVNRTADRQEEAVRSARAGLVSTSVDPVEALKALVRRPEYAGKLLDPDAAQDVVSEAGLSTRMYRLNLKEIGVTVEDGEGGKFHRWPQGGDDAEPQPTEG